MGDNQDNKDNYEDPLAGKDIQVQLGDKSVPLNRINKPHARNPCPHPQPQHQPQHHTHSCPHSQGNGAQKNTLVLNNGHRPTADAKK